MVHADGVIDGVEEAAGDVEADGDRVAVALAGGTSYSHRKYLVKLSPASSTVPKNIRQ